MTEVVGYALGHLAFNEQIEAQVNRLFKSIVE